MARCRRWHEERKQLELNALNLRANDSSLKGQASVTLDEKPKWVLDLQFDKLNLENLLPLQPVNATDEGATQVGQSRHAVASGDLLKSRSA